MLVHSYYDEDPRVRREAESLVAAGRPVDVYALRRADDPSSNEVAGVAVHRLERPAPPGCRPPDVPRGVRRRSSSAPAGP